MRITVTGAWGKAGRAVVAPDVGGGFGIKNALYPE